MASRIRVLSESMVQKIAAGEVVERPASVVKELAENAVDAEARRVRVDIAEGGLQAISVSDDGTGMSREDAQLSVVRHATSKMATPSDLFAIATLGFRGEALASIGAVSRMTIETRADEEQVGTRVVVEGGIVREVSPLGRARGTSVAVRGLFFNTPARRKFMRQPETEGRQVTQVLVHLAAACPEVGLELTQGGRTLLSCAAGTRADRASELLGVPLDELLEGRHEEEGIGVHLYLSPPGHNRRTRGRQYMVIRGRPVAAPGLQQSLYEAYGSLLAADTHPSFLCWCDLDPRRVDVNVHPAKREIRFADEHAVREAVRRAARQALRVPEAPALVPGAALDAVLPSLLSGGAGEVHDSAPAALAWPALSTAAQLPLGLAADAPRSPGAGTAVDAGTAGLPSRLPCWQVHGRYIVAPTADGLLLLDQQAAHRRVLYEEALAAMESQPVTGQQLLFPHALRVDALEASALAEAAELLARLGFAVREFGPGTVMVEAVPAGLRDWGEGQVLFEILRDFVEERRAPGRTLAEALALSYARRAAVRGGVHLEPAEMQDLVTRLLRTCEPKVCPGGRRAMVVLDARALEALFGRG